MTFDSYNYQFAFSPFLSKQPMRDLGALERMICAFLLLAIHVKNGLSGFSPTNMKYVVCKYVYIFVQFEPVFLVDVKCKVTSLIYNYYYI